MASHSSIPRSRSLLLEWFAKHRRDLPWRTSKEPYQIWLSEIILQQTRVDQGLPYFDRIVSKYPTVEHLAAAKMDDLLILWEGLGYYSRARNLRRAALTIMNDQGGRLPENYQDWLALPGVGPYTAAAISSIAFGEARAVVDGNVIRVLSRFFACSDDVTSASGKKSIQRLAEQFLNQGQPGEHNEAVMELGALICSPKNPGCDLCPLRANCKARALGQVHDFPVKKAAKPSPHYDISVAIIRNTEGHIFIQKRAEEGMLGGLWEFPGGKNEPDESFEETCLREVSEELGVDAVISSSIGIVKHAYSHFKISMHAYECSLPENARPQTDLQSAWVAHENLADYAFPRANRKLLDIMASRTDGTENPAKD